VQGSCLFLSLVVNECLGGRPCFGAFMEEEASVAESFGHAYEAVFFKFVSDQ
jgi:hypothetical protein